MLVVVPRSLAEQVATMVLNGHLWESRKSTAPLPCDENDRLNGGLNVRERACGLIAPSFSCTTNGRFGGS